MANARQSIVIDASQFKPSNKIKSGNTIITTTEIKPSNTQSDLSSDSPSLTVQRQKSLQAQSKSKDFGTSPAVTRAKANLSKTETMGNAKDQTEPTEPPSKRARNDEGIENDDENTGTRPKPIITYSPPEAGQSGFITLTDPITGQKTFQMLAAPSQQHPRSAPLMDPSTQTYNASLLRGSNVCATTSAGIATTSMGGGDMEVPQAMQIAMDQGLPAHQFMANNLTHAAGNRKPIYAHIPTPIREKISIKEYIDLAAMLDAKVHVLDEPTQFFNQQGQLILQQQKRNRFIGNWLDWLEAFLIFSALHLTFYPHEGSGIMQYIATIKKAALKTAWFSVYNYEKRFRAEMAIDNTKSWAETDVVLWTEEILGGDARVSSPMNLLPARFARPPAPRNPTPNPQITNSKQPCRLWNWSTCFHSPCRFAHICLFCFKPNHTAKEYYFRTTNSPATNINPAARAPRPTKTHPTPQ